MPDWIRKAGSRTGHPLEAVLEDDNGPVDLPLGTTATIRLSQPGAQSQVVAPVVVVKPGAAVGDPDRGRVRYTPAAGDLVAGIFDVDFVANIPVLGDAYFPEDGYMNLLVMPAVPAATLTAGGWDILIDPRVSFSQNLNWQDARGNTISLIGYSAQMTVSGASSSATFATDDGSGVLVVNSDGTLGLNLSPLQSSQLVTTVAPTSYAISVTRLADGNTVPLVSGSFTVEA